MNFIHQKRKKQFPGQYGFRNRKPILKLDRIYHICEFFLLHKRNKLYINYLNMLSPTTILDLAISSNTSCLFSPNPDLKLILNKFS